MDFLSLIQLGASCLSLRIERHRPITSSKHPYARNTTSCAWPEMQLSFDKGMHCQKFLGFVDMHGIKGDLQLLLHYSPKLINLAYFENHPTINIPFLSRAFTSTVTFICKSTHYALLQWYSRCNAMSDLVCGRLCTACIRYGCEERARQESMSSNNFMIQQMALTGAEQENNLGSTCDLDLSDPNKAWYSSKAPSFLDTLMYQRGSGNAGSIASLDKKVDMMASHQQTSIGNTANCPLPSAQDCKDTTKYSAPVCKSALMSGSCKM